MPRRGRTSKLTAELAAAFCDALAGGLSRAKAAAVAGGRGVQQAGDVGQGGE